MSKTSRGGLTLKTGKIGRVNCLRQQLMMPGERMNISMNGNVRLETLRERDVFRINAHLATFMTPLRWLFSDWPEYVSSGGNTGGPIPSITNQPDLSKYGIGAYNASITSAGCHQFWRDALLRIYNEWYKWPEDGDATTWDDDGEKAVPLSKSWSRCRYNVTPDITNDYMQPSATQFDVRDLAATQAKFRSAMKRDVLSFGRWMELVQQTWKGDGSREVDQVPIMLDQVEVGVNPRDMPATDGASLGQWQSIYDFDVDHSIRGIVAPEHCVISTMLVVRFASVTEGKHPLAEESLAYNMIGDPEILSALEPEEVFTDDFFMTDASTSLGYLPAGWQWRADHDVIGARIDVADSFPYMSAPTTQAETKDATRIKDAFRSARLGDYVADIYFREQGYQPFGTAMDSYFSGMMDDVRNMGNSGNEFPHGGKQL